MAFLRSAMLSLGNQRGAGSVCSLVQRATRAMSSSTNEKLYELRTYTVRPSDMKKLMTCAPDAMIERQKHSVMRGYWTAEIGALNQLIHLWEYDSYEHRTQVRTTLAGNKGWIEASAPMIALFEAQTNAALRLLPETSLESLAGNVSFYKFIFKPETKASEMTSILQDFSRDTNALGVWTEEVGPTPYAGYAVCSAASLDSESNPYRKLHSDAMLKLRSRVQSFESKILHTTPWAPQ